MSSEASKRKHDDVSEETETANKHTKSNITEFTTALEEANTLKTGFSQFLVGLHYKQGAVVEKDFTKAFEWMMMAANQGDPDAMFNVGHSLKRSLGVEANRELANEWFKKANDAYEKGVHSKYSNMFIALAFHNGDGKKRSVPQSMEYFKLFVEENCGSVSELDRALVRHGTYMVGKLYEELEDMESAFCWYERAANCGYLYARFLLGTLYEKGKGVPKDMDKAMEYYEQSAKEGSPSANFRLAAIHSDSNPTKSMEYLQKAADEGLPEAFHMLGMMAEESNQYDKALEYVTKAANMGLPQAEHDMGRFYEEGLVVERNYEKALEWYKIAAKKRCSTSQNRIGCMYYDGKGVEKDYHKALHWFLMAASQRDKYGTLNMGRLFESGHGVEKSIPIAISYYENALRLGNRGARRCLGLLLINNNRIDDGLELLETFINHSYDIENYEKIKKVEEDFGIHEEDEEEEEEEEDDEDDNMDIYSKPNVIVRTSGKDYYVNESLLKRSKYFATMMNEHWKGHQTKEDDMYVIDMVDLQKSIIDDQIIDSKVFGLYFNYLHAFHFDFSRWYPEDISQFYHLAHYLNEHNLCKSILESLDCFYKYDILEKSGNLTERDYANLSCRIMVDLQCCEKMDQLQRLCRDKRISIKARLCLLDMFLKDMHKNDAHAPKYTSITFDMLKTEEFKEYAPITQQLLEEIPDEEKTESLQNLFISPHLKHSKQVSICFGSENLDPASFPSVDIYIGSQCVTFYVKNVTVELSHDPEIAMESLVFVVECEESLLPSKCSFYVEVKTCAATKPTGYFVGPKALELETTLLSVPFLKKTDVSCSIVLTFYLE